MLKVIIVTSSEHRASAFGIRLISRGLVRDRKGSGIKTASPRQPRQVPSLKLRLLSPPPQALLPVTLDPCLSRHSDRNRIGNTVKLGNLNNWTSGRPKDGLCSSNQQLFRELWQMVGKLEAIRSVNDDLLRSIHGCRRAARGSRYE